MPAPEQRQSVHFPLPLPNCESRLLPTHERDSQRLSLQPVGVFKTVCLKSHVNICMLLISKLKPLRRSPNVKCHLCGCNPGHPDFFSPQTDLAFREGAKLQRPEVLLLSTRERGNLLLQVSQYTRQVPPERQGRFPVMRKKVTGTAGVCPSSTFTLSSSLVLDHKEGDRWLDAFRRAQVDSDRFVKSSLTTLQRITELWTGRSLLHHLVPHVHFANEKTREKR